MPLAQESERQLAISAQMAEKSTFEQESCLNLECPLQNVHQ